MVIDQAQRGRRIQRDVFGFRRAGAGVRAAILIHAGVIIPGEGIGARNGHIIRILAAVCPDIDAGRCYIPVFANASFHGHVGDGEREGRAHAHALAGSSAGAGIHGRFPILENAHGSGDGDLPFRHIEGEHVTADLFISNDGFCYGGSVSLIRILQLSQGNIGVAGRDGHKNPVALYRPGDLFPGSIRHLDGSVAIWRNGDLLFIPPGKQRHCGNHRVIRKARIGCDGVGEGILLGNGIINSAGNINVQGFTGIAAGQGKASQLKPFVRTYLYLEGILAGVAGKAGDLAVGGGADHELAVAAGNLAAGMTAGAARAHVAVAAGGSIAIRHTVISNGGTCHGILRLGGLRLYDDRTGDGNRAIGRIQRAVCIQYRRGAIPKVSPGVPVDDGNGNCARHPHAGSPRAGNRLGDNIVAWANVAGLYLYIKPVGKAIEGSGSEHLAAFFQGVDSIGFECLLPVALHKVHKLVYIHDAFKKIVGNQLQFLLHLRGEGGYPGLRGLGVDRAAHKPARDLGKHLVDNKIDHAGFYARQRNLADFAKAFVDAGGNIGGEQLFQARAGKKLLHHGARHIAHHLAKGFGNIL